MSATVLGSSRSVLAQTLDVPGAYATIQEAFDAAPNGAVVRIAPGTYRERLELKARGRTLTLRGDPDDPSRVVIDGGGRGPTLTVVDVGDNLLVEGITFTGGTGFDGHGGGLYMVRSAATFRRCVFRDNTAATDGGGAYVLESAGLFQECEFRNNTARHGAGLLLHHRSTTVFDRCRFLGNRATMPDVPAGIGGAFFITNSSPIFLDCLVQGNHATSAGGGGVILSPAWDEPERTTLIRGCLIAENSVDAHPGSLRQGGGLHVEDNVRVRIVDSVIRANTALGGGGIANYRAACELENTIVEDNQALPDTEGLGGFGGGLFVQSVNATPPDRRGATLSLVGSVVRRNTGILGGGIFAQGDFVGGGDRSRVVVERSLIADNTATEHGGGIQADRTVATVRDSHLLRNRASVFGGGITGAFGTTLTVTDTTLAGNTTDVLGGAIFCDRGGSLDVAGSRITGNRAGSAPANAGGAIAIGEAEGPVPGAVTGRVTSSIIADNGANELWESECSDGYPSTVTFVDNTIHSEAGLIYMRYCGSSAESVPALNALAGKASGNVDALPAFVSFLAVPAAIRPGDRSVLSWVAPAAASLGVTPGPGVVDAPLGMADVTPAATTTYGLDGPSISPASATVRVGCARLGMAVARAPGNGALAAPGDARLRWFAAGGASSYDVYVDRGREPTTLVGADVAETALGVADLAPSAEYRWRIVAKSPGCAPVTSPVFTFTTCASAPCVTHDFSTRDVGTWRVRGRGKIEVVDGMLEVRGEPRVRALAPRSDMGAGTVELTVVPWRGRRLTLYVGYVDKGNTVELAMNGGGGWKLTGRRRFARRVLARGRHAVATRRPITVRLEIAGSEVVMFADDVEVLRGAADRAVTGAFGVGTRRGAVRIDDIRIARHGP